MRITTTIAQGSYNELSQEKLGWQGQCIHEVQASQTQVSILRQARFLYQALLMSKEDRDGMNAWANSKCLDRQENNKPYG